MSHTIFPTWHQTMRLRLFTYDDLEQVLEEAGHQIWLSMIWFRGDPTRGVS